MLITIALVLLSLLHTCSSQLGRAILTDPPKRCSCGYVTKDTKEYFTHAIFNDFSTYGDASGAAINSTKSGQRFANDWAIQNYLRPLKAGELLWGYDQSNVWIQGGRLNLRQIGYTEDEARRRRPVLGAEMVTTQKDILYGSFRVKMRILGANGGTVASMNWYRDDQNEIDMEIRGINKNEIEYSVHPTQNSSKQVIDQSTSRQRTEKPWTEMQEYRFDWNRTGIHFFEDNHVVWSTAYHIPRVSGGVHLTLWASGTNWTGFPSSTNVTLEVQSVTIFYNTSTSYQGLGCEVTKNTVCDEGKDSKEIADMAKETQTKNIKNSGAVFFWSASVGALALAMGLAALI